MKRAVLNLMLLVTFFAITAFYVKPLPKLFLIGDSISIQYGPFLEKYLQGKVQFERKVDDGSAEKNLDIPTGANGGDSSMVLEYLRTKVQDRQFTPDYLLLNCGLHDIKRNPESNKIQISEDEYRTNLKAIFQLLKHKKIQAVWMKTTPVVDSIHNANQNWFRRYAADVAIYNQIADEVCAKENIPVIDLYDFTRKLGVGQFADHVHYKENARALQAAYITGFLENYIK
ncbi:SGNH/GDSL hydrolase family protein [Maribacter sp. ANRC-HE7]|uniref:SGNH/GDSL hydrolase family protein n=1 Tax=Maribacter aquimaris TaxID=2737171 RepID=A0ABR7UZ06_9FLAO|nr:SGNH/GDSL hydrolase family protein [Maribacter aquimaris]MBD0777837.1 SGNH/GDSL hydrolase family protein [Maribacter aquimaris]